MKPMTTTNDAMTATSSAAPSTPSTRKAATTVPKVTKGERRMRRKNMLRPSCTCWESLVTRVTRVARPSRSTSARESESTWRKRSSRSAVPKAAASLEQKYWAVTEMAQAKTPMPTSSAPWASTKAASRRAMPTSMTWAITSGTRSWSSASSILKRGASTHWA